MLRLTLTILPALFVWQRPCCAGGEPTTNITVMQGLARSIGVELAERIPGHDTVTVLLTAAPEATAWLVQGPIRQALAARPARLVTGEAQYGVECAVSGLRVQYENSRRSWLFGARSVDRVVEVSLDCTLTDRKAGSVLVTGSFVQSSRDTIEVSSIPFLEEGGIPFTHGSIPAEGFFSWAAEPLIMIGAIAVSVYLLFHVRS